MSGTVVKIAENTVSTAVSSVTLTGMDSTYDTYMVTYRNMQGSVNEKYPQFRFTESGTANETNNYDYAFKKLKTYSDFAAEGGTNVNLCYLTREKLGDQTEETANGHMYIFNASNSGEYTTATLENSNRDAGGNLMSATGGLGFTGASAVDGIYFFIDASNIVSGEFVLYGIRKG